MSSTGNLSMSSLAGMLRSEAPSLDRYLPGGLFRGAAGTVASTASRAVAEVRDTSTASTAKWLVPLGVLGAILVAWLVYRSLNAVPENPKPVATASLDSMNNAASAAANKATAAWASLGDFFKTKLPDGTELNIPSLGVEARLIKYLNDGSAPADKDTWFDFDRLLFDTGSATLQPASDEQLHNIAEILKAYPTVKIRIGGYTDNTGDAGANVKLSQDRANNVMAALTEMGVDPARMTAKGYGEDHPIADNSTDEGRQKNRRISMRIVEK
jgi:outer membrane protein OmpA-like peptidoglycan-associated protein